MACPDEVRFSNVGEILAYLRGSGSTTIINLMLPTSPHDHTEALIQALALYDQHVWILSLPVGLKSSVEPNRLTILDTRRESQRQVEENQRCCEHTAASSRDSDAQADVETDIDQFLASLDVLQRCAVSREYEDRSNLPS